MQQRPEDEFGLRQAEATGQYVATRWPLVAVYASPLRRTMQTAAAVAGAQGLSVQPLDGLKDINFGAWQGRLAQELAQEQPEMFRAWMERPHTVRFPGGETLDAVRGRVVAALEETLFRGAVFGSLRKELSFVPALCLSSAVYAWAHFFARARWEERVDALAGLAVLRGMLSGLTNVQALLPGFLTLTLAGALLAWGYERTGRLAFSMGLHAGWIFWLKAYGALTDPAPGGSAFWWGSGKLVDGWAAFLALAAARFGRGRSSLLPIFWLLLFRLCKAFLHLKSNNRLLFCRLI